MGRDQIAMITREPYCIMSHIFISYAREDTDVMQWLRDDFRAQGLAVWTDENLQPGTDNWRRSIQDAIREAGCLVVVMSPDSAQSEWVQREVAFAEAVRKPIFPILARGTEENAVLIDLIGKQWTDTREDYNTPVFGKLIPALQDLLGVAEVPAASSPDPAPAEPYIPDEHAEPEPAKEKTPAPPPHTRSESPFRSGPDARLERKNPFTRYRQQPDVDISDSRTKPFTVGELQQLFGFTQEELELNRQGKPSKRQRTETTDGMGCGMAIIVTPLTALIGIDYFMLANGVLTGTGATIGTIALVIMALLLAFFLWIGFDIFFGKVQNYQGTAQIKSSENGTQVVISGRILSPNSRAAKKLPQIIPGHYKVYKHSSNSKLLSIEPVRSPFGRIRRRSEDQIS